MTVRPFTPVEVERITDAEASADIELAKAFGIGIGLWYVLEHTGDGINEDVTSLPQNDPTTLYIVQNEHIGLRTAPSTVVAGAQQVDDWVFVAPDRLPSSPDEEVYIAPRFVLQAVSDPSIRFRVLTSMHLRTYWAGRVQRVG